MVIMEGLYLRTGEKLAPPDSFEVQQVLVRHLRALHDFYGEQQGLRVARKHIGWYLKGRAGGSQLRSCLMKVNHAAKQIELIEDHFLTLQKAAA